MKLLLLLISCWPQRKQSSSVDHKDYRHVVHWQSKAISELLLRANGTLSMHQNVLWKVMDLQQSMGAGYCGVGPSIGPNHANSQFRCMDVMRKFILCSVIHQLLLSSGHMFVQRSGQWIQPNSPNSPRTSSFLTQQQNICSISHVKRCPKVSKSIWRSNYFPESISKLEGEFC